MNYAEATESLRGFWESWADAEHDLECAKNAYRQAALQSGIKLCQHCSKPMPDDDHSQTCDGCHLPWGWDTPQGRRDQRADELDAQLARLQKEREALRSEGREAALEATRAKARALKAQRRARA